MLRRFRDRFVAGRELAKKLVEFTGNPHVLLLALPRGDVPVAFEVARVLRTPPFVFTQAPISDQLSCRRKEFL